MKKKLLFTIAGFCGLLFSGVESKAQSLIYYWDFNSANTCGAGGVNLSPIMPDYPANAKALLVLNQVTSPLRDSIVDSSTGGTGVNAQPETGNDTTAGSCGKGNLIIKLRNPSSEDKFLWYLPTTGYKNIILSFATQSSGKELRIWHIPIALTAAQHS